MGVGIKSVVEFVEFLHLRALLGEPAVSGWERFPEINGGGWFGGMWAADALLGGRGEPERGRRGAGMFGGGRRSIKTVANRQRI